MDRRRLLKYLSIGVAGTSLTAAVQSLASASGGTVEWGYTGAIGPSEWGNLTDSNGNLAYPICGEGRTQSPITLKNPEVSGTGRDFALSYSSFTLTVKNTGKTIQVDCPTPASNTLTLNGKKFELLQLHFHEHSEHTRNTEILPMELHLVHGLKDASGNIIELAVIGVFLETTSVTALGLTVDNTIPNAEIAKIFDQIANVPNEGNSVTPGSTINPQNLLPALTNTGYYRYSGSLTTPPCSQIVNWIVYHNGIGVTANQVNQFKAEYTNNFRPVQKLNLRVLAKDTV